jgi:hypothetical protein
MIEVSRNLSSPNFQTIAPPASIMRTAGTGFSPPPPTVQREPGSTLGTVFMAATPEPGASNPRTAGTRTVNPRG